jgi:hypothetical protein
VAYEQTKTVGGADVIIYQRNVGTEQAIHGAYHNGEGDWYVAAWDNTGRFNPERRVSCDLVESLPKKQAPEPEYA